MPLKLHFIAICFITVLVFVVWKITQSAPIEPVTIQAEPVSSHAISIIHATWGNNCKEFLGSSKGGGNSGFANDPQSASGIREDNVLLPVSSICNGKQKCTIELSEKTFGINPVPNCAKTLEVQYRCFSFDRPWTAKSDDNNLSIVCNSTTTP
jgi:hypothetical protein